MTQKTKQRERFAFGASRVDDIPCPATAAGLDPSAESKHGRPGPGRIAEQYDVYVRMELFERDGGDYSEIPDNPDWHLREKLRPDLAEGTVDADLARECWARAREAQDEWHASEAGDEVAEKLGWDD